MKFLVIINKESGKGTIGTETRKTFVEEAFNKYHENPDIEIKYLQECVIDDVLEDSNISRPDVVIAAGGDGTISSVVRILAGTGIKLGVIPFGTYNNFARDAGVPSDTDTAVRAIIEGRTKDIDVAEVNGNVFINNSSIGFYPRSVVERDRNSRKRGIMKYIAMTIAFIKVFLRFPLYQVVMYTDKGEKRAVTPFVFIGNNKYTLDIKTLGSRESLAEGILSLFYIKCRSRLCMLKIIIQALFNKLHEDENFFSDELKRITLINRRKKIYVSLDGEVIVMRPPLEYRIRPKSLKIILPE